MTGKLFLSHSSKDKDEAQVLRRALEDSGIAVWEDALELRAGDRLGDLEREVKGARGLLLLWTPAAAESEWVEREAGWAREAWKADPEYRLLVVLKGGGRVSARRLIGEELVFIPVDGAIEAAVTAIREALGERAIFARAAGAAVPPPLLEELVVSFSDARIEESDGRRRAAGRFRVEHRPAQGAGSRSGWQEFESPLGPIELEEIRWYLERYHGWPFGTFRERARKVEDRLPEWGRALYDQTLGTASEQVGAWSDAGGNERRVIVEVEDPGGKKVIEGAAAGAAALLALPWELLADEEGYLFEGGLAARVVRRIPRKTSKVPLPIADRLRVLLVIARPEEEGVSFLDPRASARPLIEALAPLGHRAELEVLADGTFRALREALARAQRAGRPFHVVHFDGHGVYDKALGLGKLCFEDPADAKVNKHERRAELVDAPALGALLRNRRVPLFVLEACQTAVADQQVTASVAARLLQAGVGSVLAMTHAVLVETSRRFVGRFYGELAAGRRIGTAMVEAQHFLRDDTHRGEVGGHGELTLEDWFVPVLFQEEDGDLRLLEPAAADPQDLAAQRAVREGELPEAPRHGFVGRARELLAVQRRLRDERSLTLVGDGGQGKTALAIECARWLLDLRLFERVAFVSVEDLPAARLALERLGRQLVPDYSVAKEEGTGTAEERQQRARLPVERVLAERRVLLVIDNVESVLAAPGSGGAAGQGELFALLHELVQIGVTRLLFTSREEPPTPFGGQFLRLGPLSKREGRELVAAVLTRIDRAPAGEADEERIDALVETVGGHARSLVLLAPLVAEQGLQVTATSVARRMAELESQHPGMRELSLLASVRLSLDRLLEKERRQVRALAVFHGAAHVQVLAYVLQVDSDEAMGLCRSLVALGLADAVGPYLLPDPALAQAVASELAEDEHRGMEERWLQAMLELIEFLYQMQFQDAAVAAEGTQAALKDLLAAVAIGERRVGRGELSADRLMKAVTRLQQLVRALGRPTALATLEVTRRRLEGRLGDWSHARFEAIMAEIEQRLATGDVSGAVSRAEGLKQRTAAAGDTYPETAYDHAMASNLLAQALVAAGRAAEAATHLDEAEMRFIELAQAGGDYAARMVGVVAARRGDALAGLGRLEKAAACYERSISISEERGDRSTAAAGRGQLGTVRLLQGKLGEALDAYEQALRTFVELREPRSVAVAWHQIGRVHEQAEQWDRAEAAYQSSLRIEVEVGNKEGQASTLGQIGNLYQGRRRFEEAAQLHRQAATLREELGDSFTHARSLSSLALALCELGRLDDAREAATYAAHLKAPFGHAAQPWKTWFLLFQIETSAGRPTEASAARLQAIELYSAYRRDGGEPQFSTAKLIATVGEVLHASGVEHARRLIPAPEQFEPRLLPSRDALLAILDGTRDPAVALDPRLDYDDAAELALLLESLSSPSA